MDPSPNFHHLLTQQVEFYLSPANMLSDSNLCETIKANHSWLPISYLLNCKRIKKLLPKLKLGKNHQRKKIAKILSQSKDLKVCNWKVKRRIKLNAKTERQKLIYVEMEDETSVKTLQNQIQKYLQEQIKGLSVKKNTQWAIIVPEHQGQTSKLLKILQQNQKALKITKVLDSKAWEEACTRYDEVVRKIEAASKQASSKGEKKLEKDAVADKKGSTLN